MIDKFVGQVDIRTINESGICILNHVTFSVRSKGSDDPFRAVRPRSFWIGRSRTFKSITKDLLGNTIDYFRQTKS